MATRKAVENTADFIRLITRWKEIEEEAAANMERIIQQTDNVFIQALMRTIKRDAENHQEILALIHGAVVKRPVALTLEELEKIWGSLEHHIETEKEVIQMAEKALHDSRHFVLRHLLSYLVEDEQKHLKLLNRLDDFKRRIYPSL
jgi:hypothetical protein